MAKRVTRNISLTPQMDRYVTSAVKSGRYESASEFFRDAFRMLQDRDAARAAKRAEFYRAVDEGVASLREGRVVDGDAFMAEWLARPAGTEKRSRARRSA